MSDTEADSGSSFVTVTIDPDPGFTLVFDGMTATEELGRPFLIELNLSSGKARGNIESTLGSSVTLTMTDAVQGKTYFNGILTRASFTGLSGGVFRYHVELRPWLWLLTQTQDCRIFQNQSVWDIINAVFKNQGFDAIKDNRQNQAGSIVLEYCVQYRESAFDFVCRLMEQFGIYYYFQHTSGVHTLVLADDPNSHSSIGEALPFHSGQTEQRAVEDHVWEWTSDLQLRPGAHSYQDYNFTTPSLNLISKSLKPGEHQYGTFEIYDYPGLYGTTADGQTLADVRMQEHKARLQVFDGRSNARAVRAGVKLTLTNTADAALAQEYLVIRAVTTLTMAEGSSDTRGQLVDSHRVSFSAIPGSTPFRLEQSTPRPMIRGPQTALVVGDSGDEITTDLYGRIKVQFYWDRIGTKDQNSSCWIRVAQSWGGKGWGSMVIPRVGMEVVVEFLEGNPDRPIVTGIVYNATQTVPYALPDKKIISTFKTNSSQGGGGFNELRFDDTKGTEEVFLQAQYNYNKVVLNTETQKITQDTTTTVDKGNRVVTVNTGNDTHTVSQGNHSVTVSQGNQSTTISAGNHALAVTAGGSKTTTGQAIEMTANTSITLTATTSIKLVVGGNSITIDTSGITLNGMQIKATGSAGITLDGGPEVGVTGGVIKLN
jgi:type VI secretion system secreted protein VgrG